MLQFLLLGGLLYGAEQGLGGLVAGPDYPLGEIVVDDRLRESLREGAAAQRGFAPGEAELEAMIRQWVEDELWIREARRLGLDRVDPVIDARLLRNMRFLGDERSDGELLAEARALGMDQTDTVVRRRLVQQMRFWVEAQVPRPSEAELEDYRLANRERFEIPPRIRLHHVHLSRDRRAQRLAEDATALLRRLREEEVAPEEAARLGDPLLVPSRLGLQSAAQIARQLGPDFAAGIAALPERSWQGPVLSAYGLHLVWIHERVPAALPALAQVRAAVEGSLLEERGDARMRTELVRLRRQARVIETGEGAS